MKRWAHGCCVVLALAVSAAGCGGDGETIAPTLTVTLSPTSVTVLVGGFVQFVANVSTTIDSVTFTVNDTEGGNATVGTIDSDGLYQAPATVPANTTITVEVTVANSQTGTSASDTTAVTLDSGVRVTVSLGSRFTIGTDETFPFAASVSGVPATASLSGVCDNVTNIPVPCTAVTWSVSGAGTIDSATGLYAAPSSATTTAATVTAKSVYDTTKTATASVTIVTAADPTVTSISHTVGAVGALHQDIYLAGSNFISTTNVFLNDAVIPTSAIAAASSTVLRVRVPDFMLLNTTGTPLPFTVSRQAGTQQPCATATDCQLTLSVRRPAIAGASPDSFPQGSSPTLSVNGGYFGTSGNPVVTAQFGSQVASGTVVSARQLDVLASGADASTPGLVPVTVASNIPGAGVAPSVVNVAVQPVYSSPPSAPTTLSVGTQPSSVAINTATGIAVVANRGSNDITLVSVTGVPVATSICTGALGSAAAPCTVASSPVSVAVDNLRNIALVANRGTGGSDGITCSAATGCSVAVVNLATLTVTAIIEPGVTSIADLPAAVGINPLTGLAIVAYEAAGFASIIDLKLATPAVTDIVAASTGATPRVAISPSLNWAIVTPGGAGSLSLIDLGRRNENAIVSAACTGSTVTVSTTAAHTLRVGDAVLIMGTSGTGTGIEGVFHVSGAPNNNTFTYSSIGCSGNRSGGAVRYALPVATVATSRSLTGAAFNDETQKAILVDETGPQGFVFSALDQSSSSVATGLALLGNTAGAFNQLSNTAVIVNRIRNEAYVIDPVTPSVLANSTFSTGLDEPVDVALDPGTNTAVIVNRTGNSVSIYSLGPIRPLHVLQVSRQVSAPELSTPPEVTVTSTLTTPATYSDQTLTIIGKGFTGTSVARLDGDSADVQVLSVSDRVMTVKVLSARLQAGGPRRYALDVVEGGTTSNAASFTVIQSVDVSAGGCSPQGVAIDSRRNLAVVSNAGCNNVALINLATGMGLTVVVGINPQGVAVLPQAGLAVVANHDSNSASIVDIITPTEVTKVTNMDPGSTGVAIDPSLGRAVVTANAANRINVFTVAGSDHAVTPLAVQLLPTAVAVDPENHLVAVANTSSNTVSLVDLTQTFATEHIAASSLPAGIAFDPVSTAFLTAASLGNQVLVLDPVSRSTFPLRVGINPTSIAYNFAASTLVTTNSSSQTMTVVDFLERRVRAVLSLQPSGQFAVDIHPFSNLAVIADSANNRVILRPLPR